MAFEVAQGAARLGFARSVPRCHAHATAVTQANHLAFVGFAVVLAACDRNLPLAPALVAALALPVIGFAAGLRGRAPWILKRRAMRRVGLHARIVLLLNEAALLAMGVALVAGLIVPCPPAWA